MDPPKQIDLPLDLFAVLGAREDGNRLSTARTTLLVFSQIMNHRFSAKFAVALAPMTLGTRLPPSIASMGAPILPMSRRVQSVGNVRRSGRLLGLFALAAEQLLLEPTDPGCELLAPPVQCLDLRGLLASSLFGFVPSNRY